MNFKKLDLLLVIFIIEIDFKLYNWNNQILLILINKLYKDDIKFESI